MEKTCKKCGSKITENHLFCAKCGEKVEQLEEQTVVASDSVEVKAEEIVASDSVEAKAEEVVASDSVETKAEEVVASEPVEVKTEEGLASDSVETKLEEVLVAPAVEGNSEIKSEKKAMSKKQMGIIIACVAFFATAILAFFLIMGMQKSVIKSVDVKFSGYDGYGRAQLSGDYKKKISDIMEKKNLDPSYINIAVSPSGNLKNGDKVTVSISTKLEDSPIKSETKTVEVSGLKETEKYSIDDVLKEHPVTFKGFNHYGRAEYDEDIFYDISRESDLANDDKVKVELNPSYIEGQKESGKVLDGQESKEIVVSKLEDSAKVANLDAFLEQTDTFARSQNKSSTYSTYTVTRQDSYFIGENIEEFSWFSDGPDYDPEAFSILTIYKVETKDKDGEVDSTEYVTYGYTGLLLDSNDKINIQGLKEDQKYSGKYDYDSDESVAEVLDLIKADYPSAVKIN